MLIRVGRLSFVLSTRLSNGITKRFSLNHSLHSSKGIHKNTKLTAPSRFASNMSSQTFEGTTDRYNGVTIDSKEEPCSSNQLETKIDESLSRWLAEGKRCIWFKVNISDAEWVPLLAKREFKFHHARDDFVMMCRWLPATESNLPPASHTNLGVGGLVINEENQLLAVSEQHYEYPHWKLPGGYVERGEDIVDAAKREVKEETGIDTEFVSVISFRHTHGMMFGFSDIYTIVLLRPTSHRIEINEREITKCQWMDIEEYVNHPNVHEANRAIVTKALEYRRRGLKIDVEKKTYTFGGKFTREMTMMSIADL